MNNIRKYSFSNFNILRHSKKLFCSKSNNIDKLIATTWDVVISGGGMVGCALAASLGSSSILAGKKILLLESNPTTHYIVNPDSYSNRVVALNTGTKNVFDSFKAWQKLENLRVKNVKKMVVWESCSDARISFQKDDLQQEVAYIVENDAVLNALTSTLNELSDRVDVLRGAKALDYHLPVDESEDVTVKLQDNITLKTKLLIGADGINSLVRNKMNVQYISWKYDQKGIVATLKLSEPTENTIAWQRFLPTGPIALLPLSDDLCSLVWTVSLPMSEKLLEMSDEQFVDALNSALWSEESKNSYANSALDSLRNIMSSITMGTGSPWQLPPSILSIVPKSRAAFPLGLGHAAEYVAPRVALIGDSAHRVHPLAGQGVNLGFGDVKCLTEKLEEAVYNGSDIGDLNYLLEYEKSRLRHVVPTMFSIDALNRLYSTEFTPLVVLRSLGLASVNACSSIKKIIMHQAST